jgi:hypothetical protein
MRIDATIGVAYYPVMASMPQWELPHTKVEKIHRTVGLKKLLYLSLSVLASLAICKLPSKDTPVRYFEERGAGSEE